jgi:magnesium-transporting ATPase (P-type)
MEGRARMLVTAVGINSQTGKIMAMMGVTDGKKRKERNVTELAIVNG